MALTIELWTDSGLVGGAEHWWDDVDAWLYEPSITRDHYPLTARIDPYGQVTITRDEFPQLIAELRALGSSAPPAVAAILDELRALCEAGLAAPASELRFVGD